MYFVVQVITSPMFVMRQLFLIIKKRKKQSGFWKKIEKLTTTNLLLACLLDLALAVRSTSRRLQYVHDSSFKMSEF